MKISLNKQLLTSITTENYLSAIMPTLREKKVQQFTTIALTLIAASFFGVFAINPTINTITDLQRQINDDQFVNQRLTTKISNLTQLQQQYQTIQNSLGIIYTTIPVTPDLATFISQVQGVGDENHVTIVGVQTLPVDLTTIQTGGQYNAFTFSVDVQGNYTDLLQFLSAMTTFNRLVTIDAIAVQQSAQSLTDYRMNIRGKAFFKLK